MNTGLVVVWRVTEQCDLACPFCAYSRELRRTRVNANPETVSAFGRVLGQYGAETSRDVLVSWLGGEPLRWPPLLDLAREFRRAYDLRVAITTNGTALAGSHVRESLAADFDHVVISVDGLGDTHDRLRGKVGLFAQLRDSVRALRGRVRLLANSVLLRDNIDQFEVLCRELAGWGIEELTFNALGGRDRPEFYPEHRLSPGQVATFRAALPRLRAQMRTLGLTIRGGAQYLDRVEANARGAALPIADCAPGTQFLFVDERGFASPCSFTGAGYGVHVSELRTPADLRCLPQRLAARKRARALPVCGDCPSTQVFGKFQIA